MSISIRLPNITADRPNDQIAQMRSYLYQFAQELQYALNTMEAGTGSMVEAYVQTAQKEASKKDSVETFTEIKSLIIKSSDIVNAYYDKIDTMIENSAKYASRSDYGDFKQQTTMSIGSNSQKVQQNIQTVQNLSNLVNGLSDRMISNDSYIRYGAVGTTLDDSGISSTTAPGIEIGDYARMDDGTAVVTKKRYARFTAYGLELFGESMTEAPVAYIKQNKLYISNAEITNTLRLGGYMISREDGISFDWVGV